MTGALGKYEEILVPLGTEVSKIIKGTSHGSLPEWFTPDMVPEEGGFIEVPEAEFIKPSEKFLADLEYHDQTVVVAKGGRGGRGNIDQLSLSSAYYDREKYAYRLEGKPGEECTIRLTLKSIADAGLVGFPNAGKSTLLGALSRAKPEVANYPFTTLHPTIGMVEFSDLKRITVADIPGLVEGAHVNRGLGHRFLRHVERTGTLIYVIDCSVRSLLGEDVDVESPTISGEEVASRIVERYAQLVNELELYSEGLSGRPSLLVLNKMDTPDIVQVTDKQLTDCIEAHNARITESDDNDDDGDVAGKDENQVDEYGTSGREGCAEEPGVELQDLLEDIDLEDMSLEDREGMQKALLFPPEKREIPSPLSVHRISAKFGGGVGDLVRSLRNVILPDASKA